MQQDKEIYNRIYAVDSKKFLKAVHASVDVFASFSKVLCRASVAKDDALMINVCSNIMRKLYDCKQDVACLVDDVEVFTMSIASICLNRNKQDYIPAMSKELKKLFKISKTFDPYSQYSVKKMAKALKKLVKKHHKKFKSLVKNQKYYSPSNEQIHFGLLDQKEQLKREKKEEAEKEKRARKEKREKEKLAKCKAGRERECRKKETEKAKEKRKAKKHQTDPDPQNKKENKDGKDKKTKDKGEKKKVKQKDKVGKKDKESSKDKVKKEIDDVAVEAEHEETAEEIALKKREKRKLEQKLKKPTYNKFAQALYEQTLLRDEMTELGRKLYTTAAEMIRPRIKEALNNLQEVVDNLVPDDRKPAFVEFLSHIQIEDIITIMIEGHCLCYKYAATERCLAKYPKARLPLPEVMKRGCPNYISKVTNQMRRLKGLCPRLPEKFYTEEDVPNKAYKVPRPTGLMLLQKGVAMWRSTYYETDLRYGFYEVKRLFRKPKQIFGFFSTSIQNSLEVDYQIFDPPPE